MIISDKMQPVSFENGFARENYWVWGSSVVRGDDGKYYMAIGNWSKKYPFHPGWLIGSEIVLAVSDSPKGPFKYEKVIAGYRGPQFWDGMSAFNPHLIKHNGKYVLFYTGTTYPFSKMEVEKDMNPATTVARANKRIGIMVADDIMGEWKRFDKPVVETDPNSFDNFLTTNAAPCPLPNGDILLVYKARKYLEDDGNIPAINSNMYLGALILDGDTFEVKERNKKPLFPEGVVVEDPFIWLEGDTFYLIAKDMEGETCGERQAGMLAESKDGFNWTIHKNEVSYTRHITYEDGTEDTLGNMERPFILFENGKMRCIYFASSDGNGYGFGGMTKAYNMGIELEN